MRTFYIQTMNSNRHHSIITKREVRFIRLYKSNGRDHKRPLKAVTFNVLGGSSIEKLSLNQSMIDLRSRARYWCNINIVIFLSF